MYARRDYVETLATVHRRSPPTSPSISSCAAALIRKGAAAGGGVTAFLVGRRPDDSRDHSVCVDCKLGRANVCVMVARGIALPGAGDPQPAAAPFALQLRTRLLRLFRPQVRRPNNGGHERWPGAGFGVLRSGQRFGALCALFNAPGPSPGARPAMPSKPQQERHE